jgi:hypothetical protein
MRRALLLSSAIATLGLGACATLRGEPTSDRRTQSDTRRSSAVASAHPFEVEGTVENVGEGVLGIGGRSITISRRDAPDAQLRISNDTKITLDDRRASLDDLRAGDDVRAVFDFDKGNPVAIEVRAGQRRK